MVATGGEIFARTAKTPHPTVGLLRGGHCDVPRAGCHLRPVGVACIIEPRKPLINDAARRVATLFEKWNCVIKTCLLARRKRTL